MASTETSEPKSDGIVNVVPLVMNTTLTAICQPVCHFNRHNTRPVPIGTVGDFDQATTIRRQI
ncbi:hypothetical protein UFOVP121_39 [uncultured Caudovirales phage]|uniref:Uncharacterized protein n=1 Tax=uncultured Caudovirales phage TaxID=2100421 RepID=A0A6J5LKF0_9CAUD|nr:hypothetical protein UFOVP121_39 [uncultured Caudovirales phage]CAB4134984.1 hypothetical protein UFOVP277_44 [uncultured Caudovirales phage]